MANTVAPLSYETLATGKHSGPRRLWVYGVVGIYVFLLGMMLTLPTWMSVVSTPSGSDLVTATGCCATLGLCGFSLIVIPVRRERRRPITRRSIWFPVAGSGMLAGLLTLGAGMALAEYWRMDSDRLWLLSATAGCVWAGWAVTFALIALRGHVQGVGAWLHRVLIAGSLLELLVAVPTHIVVRRRTECCAGLMTGTGICVGVVVMFLAMGPGVVFLFYRRRKQITAPMLNDEC